MFAGQGGAPALPGLFKRRTAYRGTAIYFSLRKDVRGGTARSRLGFDGLEINMGCPDRSVEKQLAGAAMMKDPENAVAVIRAARDGVRNVESEELKVKSEDLARAHDISSAATLPIPISVKTRIGYNKNETDNWNRNLLEQKFTRDYHPPPHSQGNV